MLHIGIADNIATPRTRQNAALRASVTLTSNAGWPIVGTVVGLALVVLAAVL